MLSPDKHWWDLSKAVFYSSDMKENCCDLKFDRDLSEKLENKIHKDIYLCELYVCVCVCVYTQSKNNTHFWMWLVMEPRSNA